MGDFEFLDCELDVRVSDAGWCTIVRAGVTDESFEIESPDAYSGVSVTQWYVPRRLGTGSNNTCIEGTREEMARVGRALRSGRAIFFSRVATYISLLSVGGEHLVALESPRNSHRPVLVPRARAVALGQRIREALGE